MMFSRLGNNNQTDQGNETEGLKIEGVRHVTGNDQDYLRKIPRVVVQKSALL